MEWRPTIGSKPVITLTTDFGVEDPYVGMMKAVILSIAPDVRIVDLTHGIRSHDVTEAALVIGSSHAYFPKGAIHVVVVDPGVGSRRRPLLVATEHAYFVAPDNGVLSQIYAGSARMACLELTARQFFHHPVSQTFHGRDVFAPVAAWLSRGVEPERFGSLVENRVTLRLPEVRKSGRDGLAGTILRVDKFGNLVTNLRADKYQERLQAGKFMLSIGGHRIDRLCRSYRESKDSEPFVIWGSLGLLEISCNQASAARRLEAGVHEEFELRFE
ncbi:MAG: SAM-dependent chlorinase/fluorinase [Acidobacteriota bacterium]|nr:SAM-dependent chlorinase/fluorinase [Acidobacteriota bacterium]MDE2965415.1 SAM-dependent chlorinase/fluorinase [Acidobacteriota bacterium]